MTERAKRRKEKLSFGTVCQIAKGKQRTSALLIQKKREICSQKRERGNEKDEIYISNSFFH